MSSGLCRNAESKSDMYKYRSVCAQILFLYTTIDNNYFNFNHRLNACLNNYLSKAPKIIKRLSPYLECT